MTAQEHIKAGQLDEALVALQESIRSNPGDLQERICLFQLYCVFGRWDKALTQLQVLADLNAETFLLSRLFGPVIQCEMLRGEIFAGNRTPLIFGEPAPWVSWLVQASALVAQGQWVAAGTLRDQAFEAAPPTPGSIDGQPFEWIADSDSRLGPILELILEGKYYWIPFCRIKSIHMTAPTDLRDLVWQPA